jgi:hypothetical protein
MDWTSSKDYLNTAKVKNTSRQQSPKKKEQENAK